MFWACAVIRSESGPSEIPVICQVAILEPLGISPIINLGVLTEKRPFCDCKVTDTEVSIEYSIVFTLFSMLIETVFVSPTAMTVGI